MKPQLNPEDVDPDAPDDPELESDAERLLVEDEGAFVDQPNGSEKES